MPGRQARARLGVQPAGDDVCPEGVAGRRPGPGGVAGQRLESVEVKEEEQAVGAVGPQIRYLGGARAADGGEALRLVRRGREARSEAPGRRPGRS